MWPREGVLSAEAFRGAPVALAMIDAGGRLQAVNGEFLRLWGLENDRDLIGKAVTELDPDPDRARSMSTEIAEKGRWSGEIRAQRTDGTPLVVRIDAARVGAGAEGVVLASFSDVTDLHVVEDALRDLAETTAPFSREGFLGSLVQAVAGTLGARWAFVGELVEDPPRRVKIAAATEYGKPMAQFEYVLEGTPCAEVVGKKDCLYARNVAELFPEDRFFRERGVEAYLGYPLFANDGRPLGLLVALHDAPLEISTARRVLISVIATRAGAELERLRDEQRLLETSEELRRKSEILDRAQESALLGGWEFRHERQELLWTDGLHRVLGTNPMRVRSTLEGFLAFFPQSGRDVLRRRFVDADPNADSWSEEVEARRATGETVWLRITGHAVRGADGRIRTFGSAQDISEARWFQLERQRLFDLSADMMCIAGDDGYFKLVNPAFEATLGWTKEELLERPFLEFVHPDDQERTKLVYGSILSGAPVVEFENRYRRKDGGWCWVEWRSTPILEGGILYAIARNITRRKALEDQVLHSQKLEAVGRLAGGIAHDFNNLLTAILGGVEVAARDVPEDSPSRRHLASIRTSAERAKGLTRQLLTFARRQVTVAELVDVRALVLELGEMWKTALGEDIEIRIAVANDPWRVRIDPGQLEQVLLNLAVNSRDAMPQGGSLTVTVDNAHASHERPAWPGGPTEGRWVRIRMADTGLGMPPEIQKHAFEPFFSTKPPGHGTGLGLATCHGIVEQNRGHIAFHSEPGTGTTFTVLFPAGEPISQRRTRNGDAGRSVAGGETILVVEDESSVRELTSEILSAAGYAVLLAADGDEAVEVARRHSGIIDLLFTDVVLPRRSGWDVAEILRRERPRLGLLFTSGYAEDAANRLGSREASAFLPKPYTPHALLTRIRSILDETD